MNLRITADLLHKTRDVRLISKAAMSKNFRILSTALAGALFLSVGASAALAQSIVYSDTKGKPCRQLQDEQELSEFECKGPAGQKVVFVDMGLMFGVQFGKDAMKQPPFRAADKSIGDKIEWHLDATGKPYASILRVYVGEESNWPKKPQTHQVLVVTKISGDDACHIAYINARIPNANAKAAEIADTRTPSFNCASDKPERIGNPAPFVETEEAEPVAASPAVATPPSKPSDQTSPLPPGVEAAIKDARELCEPSKVVLKNGFVSRKDVNGDNQADYVLDYGEFECDGMASFFCGSAGCKLQVLATQPGGDASLVYDGIAQAVEFKTVKGKPAMLLGLHGSACRRVGAAGCNATLLWDGKQFNAAP